MTAGERYRARLSAELASVGIHIDAPRTATCARPLVASSQPEVDPGAVRSALIAAGAPAEDLDWLVRSCPSLDAARAYRPTVRVAWCAVCDDAMEVDAHGCVVCYGKRIREEAARLCATMRVPRTGRFLVDWGFGNFPGEWSVEARDLAMATWRAVWRAGAIVTPEDAIVEAEAELRAAGARPGVTGDRRR